MVSLPELIFWEILVGREFATVLPRGEPMPAIPPSQFGTLLREIRKLAGVSRDQFAACLAVSISRVSELETGLTDPPKDPEFYDKLRSVPGFSDADVTLLQEVAEDDKSTEVFEKRLVQLDAHLEERRKTLEIQLGWQAGSSIEVRRQDAVDPAWLAAPKTNEELVTLLSQISAHRAKLMALSDDVLALVNRIMSEWHQDLPAQVQTYDALLTKLNAEIAIQTSYEVHAMRLVQDTLRELLQQAKHATQAPSTTAEDARDIHTESLQSDATILSPEVLDVLKDLERPLPIPPDTGVPNDASQVVEREAQPNNQPDQLQPAPKKETIFDRSDAKLFFEAVENPEHRYNNKAEVALQEFMKDVEKAKVTSLNKAAKTYGVSAQTFSEWVAKGLIPYEYRDKNAVYLAEEIAQEVGRDIQEAREMGVQTARLLRERHDKYFPPASNN
jgi:transcriptional regulator with XRE-family HTH domain